MSDRCQYRIPVSETIFMHYRFHILWLGIYAWFKALGLGILIQHVLTLQDIIFLQFFLKPLVDLILSLCALYDLQPVTAGALRILGCYDLNTITVFDLIFNRNKFAIDPGTYHLVSYCTVHAVCKINRCRTIWECFYISLGSETVNTVRKKIQIIFQKAHELPVIGHVALPLQNLAQPVQLLFLTLSRFLTIGSFLIFPMSCNTVFCGFMHFKCTDLDFERLSVRADQCCMQRLIHIGLRHCDIIFKSAGDRLIHLMDNTKSCITVLHSIYNDTYGKQVINLINGFILIDHLLIDAEEMLHAAIHLCPDIGILHMLLYLFHDRINKFLTGAFAKSNLFYQIIVNIRLQILKRKIIQFHLDLGNTKPHRDGSIDIHGFSCFLLLFLWSHILQGTHIMKTVRKLDQDDADILSHCKEHLS